MMINCESAKVLENLNEDLSQDINAKGSKAIVLTSGDPHEFEPKSEAFNSP